MAGEPIQEVKRRLDEIRASATSILSTVATALDRSLYSYMADTSDWLRSFQTDVEIAIADAQYDASLTMQDISATARGIADAVLKRINYELATYSSALTSILMGMLGEVESTLREGLADVYQLLDALTFGGNQSISNLKVTAETETHGILDSVTKVINAIVSDFRATAGAAVNFAGGLVDPLVLRITEISQYLVSEFSKMLTLDAKSLVAFQDELTEAWRQRLGGG